VLTKSKFSYAWRRDVPAFQSHFAMLSQCCLLIRGAAVVMWLVIKDMGITYGLLSRYWYV
jgi:hypothetical protein